MTFGVHDARRRRSAGSRPTTRRRKSVCLSGNCTAPGPAAESASRAAAARCSITRAATSDMALGATDTASRRTTLRHRAERRDGTSAWPAARGRRVPARCASRRAQLPQSDGTACGAQIQLAACRRVRAWIWFRSAPAIRPLADAGIPRLVLPAESRCCCARAAHPGT